MHGRRARDGVPRAVLLLDGEQRAAVFVLQRVRVHIGVVFVDLRFHGLVIPADLFAEGFERVTDDDRARVDALAHRHAKQVVLIVRIGNHVAALQHVEQCVRLCQRRQRDVVAAAVLADEAMTFFVKEEVACRFLRRDVGIDAVAGARLGRLEQLNLIHVAQSRADALRHADAVAGDARHVRAGDLGQVRPLAGGVVFGQHLLVAGKAAGSQNDVLVRMEGDGVAVAILGDDADALAVLHHQFLGGRAVHDLRVAAFKTGAQRVDEAHARVIHGGMRALI